MFRGLSAESSNLVPERDPWIPRVDISNLMAVGPAGGIRLI